DRPRRPRKGVDCRLAQIDVRSRPLCLAAQFGSVSLLETAAGLARQHRVDMYVNSWLTVNLLLTKERPMPDATTRASRREYRCSFCGKAQTEVKTLVAGPGVFICDECVELCRPIIEKKRRPATQEVPSLLPDNAPTDALLKTLAGYNGAFERIGAAMQDI